MRKLIPILISVALVALNKEHLNAQSKKNFWGVNAGINYVQIHTSIDVPLNPVFGTSIGLSLLMVKKNNWEMALDVSVGKFHYEGLSRPSYFDPSTVKATIDPLSGLVNFSIFRSLDAKKHFKLGVGFWMSSIINDYKYPPYPLHLWGAENVSHAYFNVDYLFDSNDIIFLSDLGPSFDAVYCFNSSAQLGFKYHIGLKNLYHDDTAGAMWKQNTLTLNFTYYFGRNETERSIFKKRPSENFKKE